MAAHRAEFNRRHGSSSDGKYANSITIICGLLFGAIIVFLLVALLDSKTNFEISIKTYVILMEIGATASIYFGQKTLNAGEEGVLSFLDNYLGVKAKPGLYWVLPGILKIQTISAKLTTVKVDIKNPRLNDRTSLSSASATITVVVSDVLAAARTADVLAVAKGLCESALRAYLAGRNVLQVESAQLDLTESLDKSQFDKLKAEASEAGLQIVSIYLDALEIPKALLDAQNQAAVERAERLAQEQESDWRQTIIDRALARGANYAEAQAEADTVTGKKARVTTTQVTGGAEGSPATVILDTRGGKSHE